MKDWGFYLPIASAILTVLWPEEFTIFDVRVCDELVRDKRGDFHKLSNLIPEHVWPGYCRYRKAVKRAVPSLHLRDKDRFLWGRSAALQLTDDLTTLFFRAK
jgi:hypothetical protein